MIEEIFKGGVAGLFSGIKDVVGAFKADPLEVMKIQAAISSAELQATTALITAQTRINEIEAASQDKFVTRWRPAAAWVCVASLAYAVLGYTGLNWFSTFASHYVGFPLPEFPKPDMTITFELLLGMLGLGGLRSYEKMHK